jgi:hypothetical protein
MPLRTRVLLPLMRAEMVARVRRLLILALTRVKRLRIGAAPQTLAHSN